MLLGFRCKNYRSIRDEQSLSMLAGPTKNLSQHITSIGGFDILKATVIYGANGAGKSNIFKAIRFSSQVIIKNRPDYGPHDTFQTLVNSENEPSMFEYEIEIKGRFFRYGFEMILRDRKVVGEWLYEFFPEEDDRLIFLRNSKDIVSFEGDERKFENINGELFIHNARRKDFWFGKTKDRFDVHSVQSWFWGSLAVIGPESSMLWDLDFGREDVVKGITDVVSRFDTGITGSDFIRHGVGDEPIDIVVNSRINSKSSIYKGNYGIFKDDGKSPVLAFRFKHGYKDGEEFFVNLNEESDGTLRIMKLSPIIFYDETQRDKYEGDDITYIVDEFDRTLHPAVVYGFLKWFLMKRYKTHKQLIMTTHTSGLLDQDLLRRDEIWFTQKDSSGATSLYSLDDYKVRFDKKIEKAYLEGYFQGMPEVMLPDEGEDDDAVEE